MLKLMKYELKKQMFSKLIIFMIIVLLIVFYAAAVIQGEEENIAIVMAIMVIVMAGVVVYVAIESLSIYARDLKTKQSYMLFMLPKSTPSILWAKILASALQVIATMVVFSVILFCCEGIYMERFGYGEFFGALDRFLWSLDRTVWLERSERSFWKLIYELFYGFSTIFLFWMFVVMLGIFVITLSYTLLRNCHKIN